jgi:hypothetical protein
VYAIFEGDRRESRPQEPRGQLRRTARLLIGEAFASVRSLMINKAKIVP